MKKRLKSCHFRDHLFTILKMVQTELPRFFLVNCDSAVPGFESSWLVSSNFPMRLVMDWLILVSKDDDVRTSWVSGYPSLLRSFTVSATLCEGGGCSHQEQQPLQRPPGFLASMDPRCPVRKGLELCMGNT